MKLTYLKDYDPREIAQLHNEIWVSHDKREFDDTREAAQTMARDLGFRNYRDIGDLVSKSYYIHSLFDDKDISELSERYRVIVDNKKNIEKEVFGELQEIFEEIYLLTDEPKPMLQGRLQREWWYYFSRKDIPEAIRLLLVGGPFIRQQIIKASSVRKGLVLGYILGKAGYYHNRDLKKTEYFLEKYWTEAKECPRFFMF